jgi:hypothetical protein
MEEPIVCAALYWPEGSGGRLSRAWLDAVLGFFEKHNLPVREYTISSSAAEKDGPKPFAGRSAQLYSHLESHPVSALSLYAHRRQEQGLLLRWQGCASIHLAGDYGFLGIPASEGVTMKELLRFAYGVTEPLVHVVYGIAYCHPARLGPEFYAFGMGGRSGLSRPPEDTLEHRRHVGRWFKELQKQKRHLRGWFRDVYPVNLLSEQHVQASLGEGKTLQTVGIGTLTALAANQWLWEVPEGEMAAARDVLRQAGLLIC